MRRHKIEIDMDILEAAKTSQILTSIFYKAKINATTLKAHLTELEQKGLIEKFDTEKTVRAGIHGHLLTNNPKKTKYKRFLYKTTAKGLEILKKWKQISEDLK